MQENSDFWHVNIGQGEKVNIEYVSANPTGPLHIGHARGAVYGDVLANILNKCGYDVTKEYYINDAGSQIDTLIDSAFLRYKEIITGQPEEIKSGLYPGEYLKKTGQKLASIYQDSLLNKNRAEIHHLCKDSVIEDMMGLITNDLIDLGIQHDVFFSETNLHKQGKIDKTLELLSQHDLVYQGKLPAPKGKIHEQWEEKEQLLFRSSNFGDEHDRPVKKQNGDWSYLAADFAYTQDKINRNFTHLIYILGADHAGYVKRIEAMIEILGQSKVKSNVQISQLVNFVKNGQPLKMSKRAGNFMTVRDVIDAVGKDIIRFMMITRRNDIQFDFDFDQVREQSKYNPVFYVQYAHVRTCSILAKASEQQELAFTNFQNNNFDLSLLSSEEEIDLIKMLAAWPQILKQAACSYQPHKITYFLIEVAAKFHGIWNLGKEDKNYRFHLENDPNLTTARLALVKSVQKILATGLDIVGVTPLQRM
jgi:arginyl-tRNA synthetase